MTHMKTIILLAVVATAIVAEAQEPRIALLLGDDGRHRDEFDGALKTLGWSADRYPCKTDNMKSLVSKLRDYDMLITAPLFNLRKELLLPGEA